MWVEVAVIVKIARGIIENQKEINKKSKKLINKIIKLTNKGTIEALVVIAVIQIRINPKNEKNQIQ